MRFSVCVGAETTKIVQICFAVTAGRVAKCFFNFNEVQTANNAKFFITQKIHLKHW